MWPGSVPSGRGREARAPVALTRTPAGRVSVQRCRRVLNGGKGPVTVFRTMARVSIAEPVDPAPDRTEPPEWDQPARVLSALLDAEVRVAHTAAARIWIEEPGLSDWVRVHGAHQPELPKIG